VSHKEESIMSTTPKKRVRAPKPQKVLVNNPDNSTRSEEFTMAMILGDICTRPSMRNAVDRRRRSLSIVKELEANPAAPVLSLEERDQVLAEILLPDVQVSRPVNRLVLETIAALEDAEDVPAAEEINGVAKPAPVASA